jgi:outer membrane protein
MLRLTVRSVVLVSIMVAVALPAVAQSKVAVIDVQRVVTESKAQEGQNLQQEMAALQDQFNKQRFTVSEQRQAEMSKEIEDKQISIRRFQDDAQRELQEAQRRELRILPIIDQIGKEQGYTLIFNKFQSGLVYADESVDVTDTVITRFNTVQ